MGTSKYDWSARAKGKNIKTTETPPPQVGNSKQSSILPVSLDASGDYSFDSDAGLLGVAKNFVTLPGDAYYGKVNLNTPEGQKRVTDMASVLTPMGAASRVRGSVFAPKSAYKETTGATPTTQELKTQGSKIYKEVENNGATLSRNAFKSMVSDLASNMKAKGYHPKLHPKALSAFDAISEYAGKTLTTQDMSIVRRFAKSAKNSMDPDESRIGKIILSSVDDAMRKMPEIGGKLKKADKLWSQSKKSQLFDDAFDAASKTASGLENGLRIEFRKLLKDNRKGKLALSESEKKAMEKVVEGSMPANWLKGLGKLGPAPGNAGNALLATLAATGGYALGGPILTGAIIAGGFGARKAGEALTKNAAKKAQGVVAGAKKGEVYAPSSTKETMIKTLAAPVNSQPNNTMQEELLRQFLARGGVQC